MRAHAFGKLCSFVLALVSASAGALAAMTVRKQVTPYEIEVATDGGSVSPGDRLYIRSAFDGSTVGYAEITKVDRARNSARASVISHEKNASIMIGDTLSSFDLSKPEASVRGRADMLVNDKPQASARFKKLVYLSAGPSETAQTLQKGENGISIGTYGAHGFTDRFTAYTLAFTDAHGLPTLGLKYRVYDTGDVTISNGLLGVYDGRQGTWARGVMAMMDIQSNSKLISHTEMAIFASEINFEPLKKNIRIAQPVRSSYIQSGYQYVFDNWDRLLAGPRYNLDRKSVGASLSYMWIWDTFHLLSGIRTDDFSESIGGEYGYQPQIDMFWRF